MDIIGWLRNEAEYIKNSWNKATERPVEVPEYNSVEEMLTENYGMTPPEIQQGFRVFGETRKTEQPQENQIGDEPEAIDNWARSAGVTPVTVINSELDAVHEQIRQDEEQTRLRNVIMNMALTDPKRIISEEEKRALFNAFRSNMQNDEDTMNFIDTNYVMREDYISWYKEQDYQDIEVVGISSICEGELHIHVEESSIFTWDISAQSIQQSKNTLEGTVQAYREWQSWLKDYEDQADLETAKRHLEIFGIPPTHPEYDKRLNEEIKSWKQAKEYAMAFSSGVKVIRDVGKVTEVIKRSSKAGVGEYKDVGGHHVHAKAAFKGEVSYDPNKGFSISQKFMEENGLNHADMTAKQRQLFKELSESGRPNTLEEYTRIAKEALQAGGATEEQAILLVQQSVENLVEQGVKQPTRIPWYSK